MKRGLIAVLVWMLLLASQAHAQEQSLTLTLLQQGTDYTTDYAHYQLYLQDHLDRALQTEKDPYPLPEFPGRYGAAIHALTRQHPHAGIDYQLSGSYGSLDELYTAMLAGSSEVDIILSLFTPDLLALYRAGVVEDLSSYPSIREALETWPDLTALLGDGERLFAAPENIILDLMILVAPDLLNTMGLSVDGDDWTWSDLFDMGDALYAYNQAHGTTYSLICSKIWNPAWLDQFLINECYYAPPGHAFDVETLRVLLARWKDMVQKELVINPLEFSKNKDQLSSQVLFYNQSAHFPQIVKDTVYQMPTYREGIRRTGVTSKVYFLNAASPHLQEAADFLAHYCRATMETATHFPTTYWRNGIFPGGAENDIPLTGWYPGEEIIPDPALISLWNEAMTSGYLRYDAPILEAAYDLHQAYLADQIGLEECVNGIVMRVTMLMEE